MNEIAKPTSDEKIWIVLCHLSPYMGVGLLLPLIVFCLKKDDAPGTAEHAREALNFHITMMLYAFLAIPLIFVLVGFFIIGALSILSLICAIIACVRAADGGFYRYPLTIRVV